MLPFLEDIIRKNCQDLLTMTSANKFQFHYLHTNKMIGFSVIFCSFSSLPKYLFKQAAFPYFKT